MKRIDRQQAIRTDIYCRMTAVVAYDGFYGIIWLTTGMRHNFRLDAMPEGHLPLLKAGSTLALHDGPSAVTASGAIRRRARGRRSTGRGRLWQ
jgi:hypothetical protein